MSTTLYTNAQPLECCEFKNLNRQVGVTVHQRYATHASLGDAVDICYERPTLNTATFGGWKSVASAAAEIATMTDYVIDDLDRIIAELQAHRDRLVEKRATIADDVAAALEAQS
jgi:hypothetical protein